MSIHKIRATDENTEALARLFPGDRVRVCTDDWGFVYSISYISEFTLSREVYRLGSYDFIDKRILEIASAAPRSIPCPFK